MRVRPAVGRDADALGEVHAASWFAAYGPLFEPGFVATAVANRRALWHERIACATGTILLAEIDDRPLALSYSLPSASRVGLVELYSFYAHPDSWGSGVAGVLMTETLARLLDDGYSDVHLWTLQSTAQSRRFYTKCGFIETGVTRAHDFGDGQRLEQIEYQRSLKPPAQAAPHKVHRP